MTQALAKGRVAEGSGCKQSVTFLPAESSLPKSARNTKYEIEQEGEVAVIIATTSPRIECAPHSSLTSNRHYRFALPC
jgi:hypothetical protein